MSVQTLCHLIPDIHKASLSAQNHLWPYSVLMVFAITESKSPLSISEPWQVLDATISTNELLVDVLNCTRVMTSWQCGTGERSGSKRVRNAAQVLM